MKILITGASGFLGSWLSRVISESHQVTSLVRDGSSLVRISDLKGIEIVRLEPDLWANSIIEASPDVLILNGWWGVENEYRHDVRQFNNVEHLNKLALAARSVGVKTIIGLGSQAELGPLNLEITEQELDNPTTVYGEAKVAARKNLQEILQGSESRFVWMRIFSTYGPLDGGSWLIPQIIDSMLNNQHFKLTKGEQKWSYLHAYDLAAAFLTVINDTRITGIVNVGNPETISIHEVASTIGDHLGRSNLLDFGALDYRPDQVMRMQPLCEKLTNAGWRPQIPFDEGIKQTIAWLQRKTLPAIVTKSSQIIDIELPVRT